MKKMIFAAALAALLPLLISCSEKDNTKDSLKEPRFVQSAGRLIPGDGTVAGIDLGESGTYVVGETPPGGDSSPSGWHPGTKADGDPEMKYTAGSYTVNGRRYNLNGWGWVEFDNSASGNVSVTYMANGGDEITLNANFVKSTANSDLYRTWRVDKTRVSLVRGQSTFGADFSGCDFNEIARFFEEKGYGIADDIPAGSRVNTVMITGSGSISIVYTDGRIDKGSCTVSDNLLSYSWAGKGMGYSFETGRAHYAFMDGKCILEFEVKLDGNTQASFTMVLSDIES